jgi:hypothetical protein
MITTTEPGGPGAGPGAGRGRAWAQRWVSLARTHDMVAGGWAIDGGST